MLQLERDVLLPHCDGCRKAQAAASPASQERHVKFVDDPPHVVLFDDDGDVAGCYRMFHDTLSALNNPSGFSR
jgi:hypothetical protein